MVEHEDVNLSIAQLSFQYLCESLCVGTLLEV